MPNETEAVPEISPENKALAARRARAAARMGRWDLDVAIFLFAVVIIIVILLFGEIGIEIVAPIAAVGLGLVWLVGWRRERGLYEVLYKEELSKLEGELEQAAAKEETVEEQVQKKFRERLE